jgi:energy-coupling factor transporter ATP-binding protein EcfA2
MIVSPSNDGEVQAISAGSGATELVRLSSYLASDEDTVILLDEPAARLHPTAQARLLRFFEQSKTQNVIISHSPNLLPLSNILRIALDKSRTSRVKMPSLADDMNRDDSSLDKEGTVGISAAPSGNPIASQLLKDSTLRSIPFAEVVIFVSGYTEKIVYPQWFQRWQCSRQESNGKQTDSILSDIQNIKFVNFLGDNNLTHYLRVVDGFGIPWAVIADGNSFRPESDGGGPPIPSIAKQIRKITDKFNNIINTAQHDIGKFDAEKDYDWFKLWKQKLEKCGVFSLATCWRKKDRKTVPCDRPDCNGSLPKQGTSCDQLNWHTPQMPHAESFEDYCEYEPDFSDLQECAWWRCHNKVSRALKLVEEYRTCPSSATEMFDRMSQYLNESLEAPAFVNE